MQSQASTSGWQKWPVASCAKSGSRGTLRTGKGGKAGGRGKRTNIQHHVQFNVQRLDQGTRVGLASQIKCKTGPIKFTHRCRLQQWHVLICSTHIKQSLIIPCEMKVSADAPASHTVSRATWTPPDPPRRSPVSFATQLKNASLSVNGSCVTIYMGTGNNFNCLGLVCLLFMHSFHTSYPYVQGHTRCTYWLASTLHACSYRNRICGHSFKVQTHAR